MNRNRSFQIEPLERRVVMDGTAELVKTFDSIPSDLDPVRNGIAGLQDFVETEDYLVFAAREADGGAELWRSDGTSEGTIQFTSKVSPSTRRPGLLTAWNGRAYFSDSGENQSLWQTDGTEDGTYTLKSLNGPFRDATIRTSTLDHIFFTASQNDDFGLWASDGTKEGTRLVYQAENLSVDSTVGAVSHKDGIYFRVSSRSDATSEAEWFQYETETQSVTPFVSTPDTQSLIYMDGVLFAPGLRSDETLEDSFRIPNYIGMSHVGSLAIGLHFECDQQAPSCIAVWATDGTIEGSGDIVTLSVPEISVFEFTPNMLAATSEFVLFSSSTALWRTDGTSEGTQLVSDEVVPYGNHNVVFADAVGDEIYFMGYAAESGYELWKSDGTLEGTVRLTDIGPDDASSFPKFATEFRNHVYFRTDVEGGPQELWRIPLEPLPGDANMDGFVDFADFLILANNFGRVTDVVSADGDFDADGRISFSDFLILSNSFGTSLQN